MHSNEDKACGEKDSKDSLANVALKIRKFWTWNCKKRLDKFLMNGYESSAQCKL